MHWIRWALMSAALLMLGGCATTMKDAEPRSQAAAAAPLHVTVRHVGDAWELEYHLPTPKTEVVFARRGYPFRSQWAVASPSNVKLVHRDDGDVLRSEDGAPFQELTLKVPTYVKHPEKDYQVFIPYTDGGLLFYTGQFDLELPEAPESVFTLVPQEGEHLVLMGEVHREPAEYVNQGDGTYVYFGHTTPVVTEHVTAVIDSGLPPWILQQTEELIPKLFALYAEKLHAELTFKPVVFISYGDYEGRSFGGGTLPGVVQLEYRFPRGLEPNSDPALSYGAAFLVAHESAHLWNAQLFRHQVQGGEWLHEGSADALAMRALKSLGLMTEAAFWQEQSQAASNCLLGLEGQPLKESGRPGKTKNFYYCGGTLNLLAEAAMRKANAGDLFTFWSRVFAVNGDGTYDDAGFYQVLGALPDAAPTVSLAKRIVEGPVGDDLDAWLQAELSRLGVQSEVEEKAPAGKYQLVAGARAAFAVIGWDCGPSGRPEPGSRTSLKLASTATCKTLSPGQGVDRIEGHLLFTDGAAAWDALVAKCAQPSGSVAIGTAEKAVSVPCGQPNLPRRPAVLKLSGFQAP